MPIFDNLIGVLHQVLSTNTCISLEPNPDGLISQLIGKDLEIKDLQQNFGDICIKEAFTNPITFTIETINGNPGALVETPVRASNFSDIFNKIFQNYKYFYVINKS